LNRSSIIVGIILFVLFLDQSLKIWVKTNMEYGEYFNLLGFDWAQIHFVENNGMAFGLSMGGTQGKIVLGLFMLMVISFLVYFFKNPKEAGVPSWIVYSFLAVIVTASTLGFMGGNGDYGKLALSLFRIAAVFFLIYYIAQLLDTEVHFGLLISFALILAGALGNIIDSAIYGKIFSASPYHGGLAELFPENGGYADFLYGKVVDMLYFPLIKGHFPSWFPFWGDESFLFFRPVFNLADTSITLGVLNILLFQRDFFADLEKEEELKKSVEEEAIDLNTTSGTDTINKTSSGDD